MNRIIGEGQFALPIIWTVIIGVASIMIHLIKECYAPAVSRSCIGRAFDRRRRIQNSAYTVVLAQHRRQMFVIVNHGAVSNRKEGAQTAGGLRPFLRIGYSIS